LEYVLHLLVLAGLYAILAISLNLVAGYCGLLSVAHAAFYGIGAYAVAILTVRLELPFAIALAVGGVIAGVCGALIAVPALRLHDDYFVLASFAFQMIIFSVLNNWVAVTGGALGVTAIPAPAFLGFRVESRAGFLALVLLIAAITSEMARRVTSAPFGRVLKAIREDEVLAQALGKNVVRCKVTIFVMAAILASIAGGLYAAYLSVIDPSSFTVMESIFILSIVIIGGAGSFWGPILGTAVLITLPEALRFLGLPVALAANVRQMLYGALLTVLMIWRPQGFVGGYPFSKR
jgi:branched-chain amino acid transport system permease protein